MTALRTIDVFVENPKGALAKIHHDEVALVPTHCELVNAPYAYAYGFVVGVPSGDGDMLDCFVISEQTLYTGDRLDCVPFGYLEQWENDDQDFDILAVPAVEAHRIDSIDRAELYQTLQEFLLTVFAKDPERNMRVGALRGAQEAFDLIDHLTPSSVP